MCDNGPGNIAIKLTFYGNYEKIFINGNDETFQDESVKHKYINEIKHKISNELKINETQILETTGPFHVSPYDINFIKKLFDHMRMRLNFFVFNKNDITNPYKLKKDPEIQLHFDDDLGDIVDIKLQFEGDYDDIFPNEDDFTKQKYSKEIKSKISKEFNINEKEIKIEGPFRGSWFFGVCMSLSSAIPICVPNGLEVTGTLKTGVIGVVLIISRAAANTITRSISSNPQRFPTKFAIKSIKSAGYLDGRVDGSHPLVSNGNPRQHQNLRWILDKVNRNAIIPACYAIRSVSNSNNRRYLDGGSNHPLMSSRSTTNGELQWTFAVVNNGSSYTIQNVSSEQYLSHGPGGPLVTSINAGNDDHLHWMINEI
eukprot:510297_1